MNGILKTEWLYDDHFKGLEEAYKRVAQVINPSNHKQPPLSLNYQTPAPAYPETGAQARVWKNSYKANKPEEAEPVIAEMTGGCRTIAADNLNCGRML